MRKEDSLTHPFLKLVGSTLVNVCPRLDAENVLELFDYATKNRLPLLYLQALKGVNRLGVLREKYDELITRFVKSQIAIGRVSTLFDKTGVRYAFFKSIRPYQEVTVDIDILIFGSDYEEAIQTLQNDRYKFLGDGPLSTTFRDDDAEINLDIYDEVGVSNIVYLDKNALLDFVGKRELSNGAVALSLCPEADLLAIIAHSVIKEQMYVLSEYYTTLYYLANMKDDRLSSFLSLTDKCRIRSAVKTHLGMTALLHQKVHGFVPFSLVRLIKELDTDSLELTRVEKAGLQMPFKYHPITIFKSLAEKLGEEKARKSFASQTFAMLDPRFGSHVIKKVFKHALREAY